MIWNPDRPSSARLPAEMHVGLSKEIKGMEGRVSVQPDGVAALVHHGQGVAVQPGSGTLAEGYQGYRTWVSRRWRKKL